MPGMSRPDITDPTNVRGSAVRRAQAELDGGPEAEARRRYGDGKAGFASGLPRSAARLFDCPAGAVGPLLRGGMTASGREDHELGKTKRKTKAKPKARAKAKTGATRATGKSATKRRSSPERSARLKVRTGGHRPSSRAAPEKTKKEKEKQDPRAEVAPLPPNEATPSGEGEGVSCRAAKSSDYYEVLGVRKDASHEEIRASFRRRAKKYHPDRNASRAKWAEQKIRLIIQAYDTLMDRDQRAAYDRKLRQELDPDEDAYRQSLRERMGDPHAEARLILEDLLNERGDEAIEVYERARQRTGDFDLGKYLDTRDYLDSLFLLGEEYERAGEWKMALELYHKVYDLERDSPTRFFLETLKERIRDIYCKKLARRSSPADAVEVYEKVLQLGIPKKTEAYIHKKIAEAFFRAGQHKKARAHLCKAFDLEPKLKGAQKICEKLGLDFRRERARAAAKA